MLADDFDIELFFNDFFNSMYNEIAPLTIEANFPIRISLLNYDGSRTQNIRNTFIAINRNTNEKELVLDILNYLLSKVISKGNTLKITENR